MSTTLIGLHNPKSPDNVSAVLRAARSFGANEVFYTGSRYANAKRYQQNVQKWDHSLPLTQVTDLCSIAAGGAVRRVAIELVEGAVPLMDYQHWPSALYLFGAEDGSLPQQVVDACDDVVYIPTIGCLNLAMTVNIVLYDRAARLGLINPGDEAIRANRDTNNTLTVRKTRQTIPNN